MSSAASGQKVMTREEFRAWVDRQPRRYERVNGVVIEMAAERAVHGRVKGAVYRALGDAIAEAGLQRCEVFPDGMTVEVGDGTDYVPDAVINCGPAIANDATTVSDPIIVVEVLSPGTTTVDTGAKLADYFLVPSIQHYLIVHPIRPRVIHHRRHGDAIATTILSSGGLHLDPPGLTLAIENLYPGPEQAGD